MHQLSIGFILSRNHLLASYIFSTWLLDTTHQAQVWPLTEVYNWNSNYLNVLIWGVLTDWEAVMENLHSDIYFSGS